MSLFDDIQAFQIEALTAISDSTDNIVKDLFSQAVALSPTPTQGMATSGAFSRGELINQWYPNSGSTPSSEVGTALSDNGADSLSRINEIVAENLFYGRDNIVNLANNTDQAYYADVLGWPKGTVSASGGVWKGHAPYAMSSNSVNYILGKYT